MSQKRFFNSIPSEQVLSLSQKQVNQAYQEVKADWERFLKDSGIPLPKSGTAKSLQLAILKHFEKHAVHKQHISELIAKLTGNPPTDQQVRHLKAQDSWHILNRGDAYRNRYAPEGCHVLITTKQPFPGTRHRRNVVSRGDWNEILQEYDNACASCGTKIGEQHRFDASFVVETLEKGHMDPNKPLEAGNIIPQCRWCNRTARGDFTFDAQGRPRAIASTRPVERADATTIAEVKRWLRSKGR